MNERKSDFLYIEKNEIDESGGGERGRGAVLRDRLETRQRREQRGSETEKGKWGAQGKEWERGGEGRPAGCERAMSLELLARTHQIMTE